MKHITIGTAGHVDHGKTALTKALTGVDCDRLQEEKDRGITIELGFAQLTIDNDTKASIVDVPGHEKFVRTMLAGASGIDAAILVIAADEGIMPQTREHLDILMLLGVNNGIVALTKTDKVTTDEIEIRKVEISEFLRGTPFENAPIFPVSAIIGNGIKELRNGIKELAGRISARSKILPLRLPIDRSFILDGIGNVYAGTITEGSMTLGEKLTVYPDECECTVRTIQNHNKPAEKSDAGMRTAITVTTTRKNKIEKGDILAFPDSMIVSDYITVLLKVSTGSPYSIKNSSYVHLFHGTKEQVAKVRLIGKDKLLSGEEGFGQLILSEKCALRNGDRFILRFFSPVITIGGGIILDAEGSKLKRNRPETLERLKSLASVDLSVSLFQRIAGKGIDGTDIFHLGRVNNLSIEGTEEIADALISDGKIVRLRNTLIASNELEKKKSDIKSLLSTYHEKYPLQPGMKDAELKSRTFVESNATADEILTFFIEEGVYERKSGYAHLPEFVPIFTNQHKIMQRKLLHYYKDFHFTPPTKKDADEKFLKRGEIYMQVYENMLLNGLLVSLSPKYAVHHEAYADALQIFRDMFSNQDEVTLAEFKEKAGISRKYAQLFLEKWDSEGICKRTGEGRVLLKP